MKNILNIDAAICQFVDAATKHAEASQTGDHKTANKSYKAIAEAFTFLREQDSLLALLKFLNNESIGVRIWAATYLLPIDEEKATETLKDIAEAAQGILSFIAKTTLNEWMKGNLKKYMISRERYLT